ncbi:MAG TPA: universal stress protein [Pseudomonadales bacterium]|nr:universal stress protein [Pseudomonadales bacterium]
MATKLFHRIVVPTDLSDCAEEAWKVAQRVAETLQSELVLVHVFVTPPIYGDPLRISADKTWEAYEKARQWVAEALDKTATQAKDKGVTVRPVMLTGSPAQEIVDLARSEQADLVIMGTHGRGGMSRVLLGSVADRVIRLAPCPVLTVRTPE